MNETTKVTLIKRSVPLCPVCVTMQNVLESEGIPFNTIDIAKDPEAIEKYNLSSVPVLLIDDEDGGLVKLNGMQPVELIKDLIQ